MFGFNKKQPPSRRDRIAKEAEDAAIAGLAIGICIGTMAATVAVLDFASNNAGKAVKAAKAGGSWMVGKLVSGATAFKENAEAAYEAGKERWASKDAGSKPNDEAGGEEEAA